MIRNRFTYEGTLHEVLELKTFKSGFRKRDFVCVNRNGEWAHYAVFTAKKDIADKLASMKPGDAVCVEFELDGRDWTDPNGVKKWFFDATALKVDLSGVNGGSVNQPPAPDTPEPALSISEEDARNLPF